MRKNVPVFIHIPKNGGTYIYNSIRSAGRFFLGKMCSLNPYSFSNSGDFRFVYSRGEKFPLREINIQESGRSVFTIFSTDRGSNFIKKNNLTEFGEYVYYLDLSDERIKNIISDSDIFAAIIQPKGLEYLKCGMFESFFKASDEIFFKFYFPLRDPIERLKSLFFYLKSESSNHEPTHGMYNSETFEDFIINEAPDNWITRKLCGIKNNNSAISEKDFSSVCSLIDKKNLLFFNIEEMDKMIDISFREYGFSFIKDVPNSLKELLTKFNSNNRNNWHYQNKESNGDAANLYREKLNQITKYEYKLFDFIF